MSGDKFAHNTSRVAIKMWSTHNLHSLFKEYPRNDWVTDSELLVKQYYYNNDNATIILKIFLTLKNLRKGPMTTEGIHKVVLKFK